MPKLKGKALRIARKNLRKSGCRLGKVKRRYRPTKVSKIVRQRPRPGTILAPGGKVTVTVLDRPTDV